MNENQKHYLNLLDKKNEVIKEFYRVTEVVHFTGDTENFEEEASDYIYLIEKRESLLRDANQLQSELNKLVEANPEFESLSEAVGKRAVTENLVKEIMALDKNNSEIMDKIFSTIKSSLKGIKHTKNMNSAYKEFDPFSEGYLFDQKQ